MSNSNQIKVEDNGNITLRDMHGAVVTVNVNETDNLLAVLNSLNPAQLAALQHVVEVETHAISPLFKTLLTGIASQKNIVKGNISNVDMVRIGDERHYHYHAAPPTLPKELTSLIPKTAAQTIVGRDKDLADLHARLFDNKQVVLVNGLGGIGKTTLAQVYVETFYDQYHHIGWISQISDNIIDDVVNTGGLMLSLGIDSQGQERQALFDEIIIGLKRISDRPNLLVIDNADASLSRWYDYLPNQPNWHILVTSREWIYKFDVKQLDFLTESEATVLFLKHYTRGQISDEALKELVGLVDHHTLTIEILAKTAQRQRIGIDRLKSALEDDLSANVNVNHAGHRIEKVRAYLESIFNLSGLTRAEIWLMKQFTCLPPEFYSYDLLKALIRPEKSQHEAIFSDTLEGLTAKGWLLQNKANDSIKMHRIIAEVTARRQPPMPADVDALIASLTTLLSIDQTRDNPIDKFQWIPFGRALLHHFAFEKAASIATLQNNLALVLQDLGDYAGALSLAAKALAIFQNKLPAGHSNIAVVSNIYQAIQNKMKS